MQGYEKGCCSRQEDRTQGLTARVLDVITADTPELRTFRAVCEGVGFCWLFVKAVDLIGLIVTVGW